MSVADYEALEETARLLRSPANARRLLESLRRRRLATATNTTSVSEARLHTQRLDGLQVLVVSRSHHCEADRQWQARYHYG